jgi:hypothetical protein
MSLPAHTLLPSFAALRDYGNTSCSTTWYVMAYMESIGSVCRGQHIMQVRQKQGSAARCTLGRSCMLFAKMTHTKPVQTRDYWC